MSARFKGAVHAAAVVVLVTGYLTPVGFCRKHLSGCARGTACDTRSLCDC